MTPSIIDGVLEPHGKSQRPHGAGPGCSKRDGARPECGPGCADVIDEQHRPALHRAAGLEGSLDVSQTLPDGAGPGLGRFVPRPVQDARFDLDAEPVPGLKGHDFGLVVPPLAEPLRMERNRDQDVRLDPVRQCMRGK